MRVHQKSSQYKLHAKKKVIVWRAPNPFSQMEFWPSIIFLWQNFHSKPIDVQIGGKKGFFARDTQNFRIPPLHNQDSLLCSGGVRKFWVSLAKKPFFPPIWTPSRDSNSKTVDVRTKCHPELLFGPPGFGTRPKIIDNFPLKNGKLNSVSQQFLWLLLGWTLWDQRNICLYLL